MQAVVLVGGLGTRLRPLTERVPKPMVEVEGNPFLAYIVRWLAGQDFRRLLFLAGYLGEHVQDYFGDGKSLGVRIDYKWEQPPLGTAGAIRNALDKVEGEFLLLYGDSYLPIDYRQVVKSFQAAACKGMIVVYDNRFGDTGVQNNVALSGDGFVTRYQKGRSALDLEYVEAGVLCFQREVFAQLPANKFISLEHDVYSRLIAKRQLRGFVTNQRFFDIGTPERLAEFAATQR